MLYFAQCHSATAARACPICVKYGKHGRPDLRKIAQAEAAGPAQGRTPKQGL
jgi:hypothetical protein